MLLIYQFMWGFGTTMGIGQMNHVIASIRSVQRNLELGAFHSPSFCICPAFCPERGNLDILVSGYTQKKCRRLEISIKYQNLSEMITDAAEQYKA